MIIIIIVIVVIIIIIIIIVNGKLLVSSLQPDLLNFKKGWMVKLHENDQVNHF